MTLVQYLKTEPLGEKLNKLGLNTRKLTLLNCLELIVNLLWIGYNLVYTSKYLYCLRSVWRRNKSIVIAYNKKRQQVCTVTRLLVNQNKVLFYIGVLKKSCKFIDWTRLKLIYVFNLWQLPRFINILDLKFINSRIFKLYRLRKM